VSGPVRRRRRLRLFLPQLALSAFLVGLTGSMAVALQVRRVVVEGVEGAVRTQVEAVLAAAVGSPTLTVRAEELRAAVLSQVSWVAEAAVTVSLDGVVYCAVTLHRPVAVLADGAPPQLVDANGRILGEPQPGGSLPPLELVGFTAYPAERAALLAALPALQAAWGDEVRRVRRLTFRDVALTFVGSELEVLVDPSHPAALAEGKAVQAAWERHGLPSMARLDVRVPGRAAVLLAREEGGP